MVGEDVAEDGKLFDFYWSLEKVGLLVKVVSQAGK